MSAYYSICTLSKFFKYNSEDPLLYSAIIDCVITKFPHFVLGLVASSSCQPIIQSALRANFLNIILHIDLSTSLSLIVSSQSPLIWYWDLLLPHHVSLLFYLGNFLKYNSEDLLLNRAII